VTVAIPLSPLAAPLGFAALPPLYWPLLLILVVAYLGLVELVKRRFDRAATAPRNPDAPPATIPGRGRSSAPAPTPTR
jgi:Mg2+-importing ATPase